MDGAREFYYQFLINPSIRRSELCHAGFAMSVLSLLNVSNSAISSLAQSPVMLPPMIILSLLYGEKLDFNTYFTTLIKFLCLFIRCIPFIGIPNIRMTNRSCQAQPSSLICFFTAKISVLVNSLLLLFVSRWMINLFSFCDISDNDFMLQYLFREQWQEVYQGKLNEAIHLCFVSTISIQKL